MCSKKYETMPVSLSVSLWLCLPIWRSGFRLEADNITRGQFPQRTPDERRKGFLSPMEENFWCVLGMVLGKGNGLMRIFS